MRFTALATDYDGTIATQGRVSVATWEALRRFKSSGRKLILVTGRLVEELQIICPNLGLFDRVVAENGGVLYRPATDDQKLLAPSPPQKFIKSLRDRGVAHLDIGQTIVAGFRPDEPVILQTIAAMELRLQVIFNLDSVMVLPSGVNKATGLTAALDELGLSPQHVVAVGDAENDHPFLTMCQRSAAVANALPMVKQVADLVMTGAEGQGVVELIEKLLAEHI